MSSPTRSTPAFTPVSPSRLSPSPRRLFLKAAHARGWLHAPRLRQIAESSLAALRAGTLPEVALLPISPSPPRKSLSPSPSSQPSPSASVADSDDLDALCHGIETALRIDKTRPRRPHPHSQLPPFSSPPALSPSRASDTDSDSGDHSDSLALTSCRSSSPAAVDSTSSRVCLNSDVDNHDSDASPPRTRARTRRRPTPPSWRLDVGGDEDDDDVDGLCKGLEKTLRFPREGSLPVHDAFDVDKENRLLPALKGAAQWLGLGAQPFEHVRERAANKLLAFFDREVLDGRLVQNAPPSQMVTLAWSGRLTKTAGVTRMKRLTCGKRTAAIELSEKVVDEPARLYNTLAHELCHAAAWIIDECCKPPHGAQFKNWATAFKKWDGRLIITTCHEYEIRYKFKYICQGCGEVYGRHSRSINTSKKVCGKCRGALQLVREV